MYDDYRIGSTNTNKGGDAKANPPCVVIYDHYRLKRDLPQKDF